MSTTHNLQQEETVANEAGETTFLRGGLPQFLQKVEAFFVCHSVFQ